MADPLPFGIGDAVGFQDGLGAAAGVGCTDGVGVTNVAGVDVRMREGDGVSVGVDDADAFLVTSAVVDAAVDVILAAWSLLVDEVHPTINNEATTVSATSTAAFIIYRRNEELQR